MRERLGTLPAMLPHLSRGDVLAGRYRLEERVGVGSYGTVWRATDELSHEALALKVLHPEYARLDTVLARFQREATAAMRLEHPAIPATRRLHRTPEAVFIAMDLVGGYTLERWLGCFPEGGAPPPLCDVARLFERLASGVAHAHDRGVVHRDLKPQNIMIDPATLTPHILDFGLAKLLLDAQEDVADETTRGRQLGSYFFMAPEQIRGEACDARVDVFALGTILFELLTLRRPWTVDELGQWAPAYSAPVRARGNLAPDVFARICAGPRPRPSQVRALSPALDEVVVSALAIDPRARPPHARALLEAFMHAMEQDVATAATRVASLPAPVPSAAEASDTAISRGPEAVPAPLPSLAEASDTPALPEPTQLSIAHDRWSAPASAELVTLPPRQAERTEAVQLAPRTWRRPLAVVLVLALGGLGVGLALRPGAPPPRPTAYPRLHQLLEESRTDVRMRERLLDALVGTIAVDVEDPLERHRLQVRARAAARPYDEAALASVIEALDDAQRP